MNRKEIDEMMKKQSLVVESETPAEKFWVGVCLAIAFLILCLI